jgi:hypothetical protein
MAEEWELEMGEGWEALKEMCEAYLRRMHCTLWGESFNIKTEDGIKKAAEWLATNCLGMADMYAENG